MLLTTNNDCNLIPPAGVLRAFTSIADGIALTGDECGLETVNSWPECVTLPTRRPHESSLVMDFLGLYPVYSPPASGYRHLKINKLAQKLETSLGLRKKTNYFRYTQCFGSGSGIRYFFSDPGPFKK